MKTKLNLIEYLFLFFIVLGVSLALFTFFNNRSLRLDEASLALNIVNMSVKDLLLTLCCAQSAPKGFLLIEKFFANIGGNTDWSLRIFPIISYLISVILFYFLSHKILKTRVLELFSTAYFCLLYFLIFFSSDAKQYISDVMVCLIILLATLNFIERKSRKQIYLFSLVGIVAIWLSYIAIILLFSVGLYVLYNSFKTNKRYLPIFVVLGLWIISFFTYYLLFIHNNPMTSFMIKAWGSNEISFLPQNIFGVEIWKAIYYSIDNFFRLLGYLKFSIVMIVVFGIGIFYFSIKKKEILFLLLFPVIVHLCLSYFKLYPFYGTKLFPRFILYLTPILIIIISSGLQYLVNFFKPAFQRIAIFGLIFPLVFNIIILFYWGFPIKHDEIKKSLTYLNNNISTDDKLYIFYSSSRAFKFYKNKYHKVNQIPEENILVGQLHPQWGYLNESEISNIKGETWVLFSHINVFPVKFNQKILNEEEYILELFRDNGFEIIEGKQYFRSSIYKAVPVKSLE